MNPLYENIRVLRKKHKWSQEELARRVGYTHRSTIGKIENGEVDISQTKIQQFADVFGVTPQQLMGYEQCDPAQEYIDKFKRLNSKERKIVESLIDSLLEK